MSSSTVDRIKEKISIVDLVGSYIHLEKAGTNFKGKCPFHNEKTPSFFVSPARGSFYCFGCGEKGDIFSFVEKFESQDFRGALKILAERAGVEIVFESSQAKTERDRLFTVLETATLFFQRNLVDKKDALTYLHSRGLTSKSMSVWRIGYAPNEWRSLHDYLLTKGFKPEVMERAGLVKKSEKGYYDRFRSRIIFPIADSSGRIIGFSGRIFGIEDDAKYLNSPETELFKKSDLLYGFDKAKLEIRRAGFAVLVEGQMDLLMAHQAGTLQTVASSGTALTVNHLRLLKRLTNTVVFAFDSDSAGAQATARSAKEALSLGLEVKALILPDAKDPADLIQANPTAWNEALSHPVHIIDFEFGRIKSQTADKRELGRLIQKNILPYIASLESSIEKSHFVKSIARETGIREEALFEDLKKISIESVVGSGSLVSKPDRPTRFDNVERRIAGLIFSLESGKDAPKAHEVRKHLSDIIGPEESDELMKALEAQKDTLILETEIYFENHEDRDKEIDTIFVEFTRDHLKKKFTKTMEELADAERARDSKRAELLLKQLHDLSFKMKS